MPAKTSLDLGGSSEGSSGEESSLDMEGSACPHKLVFEKMHGLEEAMYTGELVLQTLKLSSSCGSGVIVAFIRMHDPGFKDIIGVGGMVMGLVTALCIQIISLFSQLALTFLLYVFPVEAAQDPYEVGLEEKLILVRNAINGWPPVEFNMSNTDEKATHDLCFQDHTIPFSQSLMIIVWVVRTIPIVSTVLWSMWAVWQLPSAGPGEFFAEPTDDRNGVIVTHAPPNTRALALCCVHLPELSLTLLTFFVGVKFLLYSPDLVTLIVTSMGLGFLRQLDSVIFEGITAHMFREMVKNSAFRWSGVRSARSMHWELWGSSLTRAVVTIVAVLFYCRVVNSDLQEFRLLCTLYKERFHDVCDWCGFNIPWLGIQLYPP